VPRKTKAESEEGSFQAVEIQFTGSPEVPGFYASAIQVLVSAFDFTLMIGQMGHRPDGNLEMREVARLNLSPEHAKRLARVLAERVAGYEDKIGPIADPPNEPPQLS